MGLLGGCCTSIEFMLEWRNFKLREVLLANLKGRDDLCYPATNLSGLEGNSIPILETIKCKNAREPQRLNSQRNTNIMHQQGYYDEKKMHRNSARDLD